MAGIWNTGIEVVREDGDATRARLLGCTIRTCHHRGVVLGGVDHETRVEGCAISGSAWHGIRYDHASPTIIANRIFDNARFGIYASGQTEAVIRGNLVLDNAMAGIGCWFHNRDTIEGNTFARNKRAGLEVLGASSPVIRRNVFFASPTAIGTSDIGDDDDEEPGRAYEGPVAVEQNVFWQNEQNGFWGPRAERPEAGTAGAQDSSPEKEAARLAKAGGNLLADPKFVDTAAGNYTLAPDSPARVLKAGADPVPGLDTAWSVQPEEEAILATRRADQDEQDAEERDWAAYQKAWPWIEDVMQLQGHGAARPGAGRDPGTRSPARMRPPSRPRSSRSPARPRRTSTVLFFVSGSRRWPRKETRRSVSRPLPRSASQATRRKPGRCCGR